MESACCPPPRYFDRAAFMRRPRSPKALAPACTGTRAGGSPRTKYGLKELARRKELSRVNGQQLSLPFAAASSLDPEPQPGAAVPAVPGALSAPAAPPALTLAPVVDDPLQSVGTLEDQP